MNSTIPSSDDPALASRQHIEADLAMMKRASARLQEPGTKLLRNPAPDSLIQFPKRSDFYAKRAGEL